MDEEYALSLLSEATRVASLKIKPEDEKVEIENLLAKFDQHSQVLKVDKMLTVYARILASYADTCSTLYRKNHDIQLLETAKRYGLRAVKLLPKNSSVAMILSYCYLEEKSYDKATSLLEDFLEHSENRQQEMDVRDFLAKIYLHKVVKFDIPINNDLIHAKDDVVNAYECVSKNDCEFTSLFFGSVEALIISCTKSDNQSEITSVLSMIERLLKIYGISHELFSRDLTMVIRLLTFAAEVEKFKGDLLVRKPANVYFQYTRFNTLESMLDVDHPRMTPSCFKLRLYNSDYMNDPEEGKAIFQFLNLGGKGRVIQENLSGNREPSHVFLASMSQLNPGASGAMPMWNTYADFHKGVALGVKLDTEGIVRDNHQIDQFLDGKVSLDELGFTERRLDVGLYRVLYIPVSKTNSPIKGSSFDKLAKIGSIIQEIFQSSISENLEEDIQYFIQMRLNQIRFLVKNDTFAYEKEVRIIADKDVKDATHDPGSPKLFVALPNDQVRGIEPRLKSITFGYNSESETLWNPIIQKYLPGVDVTRSNMKYN